MFTATTIDMAFPVITVMIILLALTMISTMVPLMFRIGDCRRCRRWRHSGVMPIDANLENTESLVFFL